MIPTETWVLPRPRSNKYKGGFPLHFEKKLIRLLGFDEIEDHERIFHPFGSMAEYGIRNDLSPEVNPNFSLDAHNLSAISDNTYDLVIVDPPYDDEQAEKLYKTPKLRYKKYVSEAVRVCSIGGFVAIYHWVMTPRPEFTSFHYRIVILTRVWHRPRICCVYRKWDSF